MNCERFEGEGMTEFTMRRLRNEIIEQCAKVAELQEQTFLNPNYASNQPHGSFGERFACRQVAEAIRSLAVTSRQSGGQT